MAQSTLDIILKSKKQGNAEKEAQDGLKNLKGSLNDTIQEMTGLNVASLSAAGAIVGVGKFLLDSARAAGEAQQVQAQLNAVLKSTGNAAGLTADELNSMASQFSELTTIEDDTISKAQAVMLTFTNIKEDVFPGATEAALNMSAALGTNLQSSVIQLGKALNDPIQGVSALREVGVSFSDSQQQVIRSLVETGQTMEAQQLILEELNTEFGGAAAAMADTYPGQIEKLKNAFGELQESIGEELIPTLVDATEALIILITAGKEIEEALQEQEKRVIETSDSYDEYRREMSKAYQATGVMVNRLDTINTSMGITADEVENVTQETVLLTDTEYRAARAAEAWKNGTAHLNGDLEQQMTVVPELAKSIEDLAAEEVQLSSDLELMKSLMEQNVISEVQYKTATLEAKEGVFQLTEQQRANYLATLDQIEATEQNNQRVADLAQKSFEAESAQLRLAESLKGATNAQIASEAINMLTQAEEEGLISSNELFKATREIQDAFGLADQKSRALSEGIEWWSNMVSGSIIPTQNADEALKALITDASDGRVDYQGLIEEYGKTPEMLEAAGQSMYTYDESIIQVTEDSTILRDEIIAQSEEHIPTYQYQLTNLIDAGLTPAGEAMVELSEGKLPDLAESFGYTGGKVSELTGKVNALTEAIETVPTKKTITFDIVVNGSIPDVDGGGGGGTKKADGPGAAGGGVFNVQSGYINDTALLPVSSGEEIIVLNRLQQMQATNQVNNMISNIGAPVSSGNNSTTLVNVYLDGRKIQQSLVTGMRAQGVR